MSITLTIDGATITETTSDPERIAGLQAAGLTAEHNLGLYGPFAVFRYAGTPGSSQREP